MYRRGNLHSEDPVNCLAADRLDLAGRDHADNPFPRRPDAERDPHEGAVDAAQLEALTMQSLAVTEVATSRMHTSLFPGRGSGTVLIWSTSGGPYPVQTAALI